MARIKKNGTEIPRKILGNGWDELIDKNCLINGMKAGRLLGFKTVNIIYVYYKLGSIFKNNSSISLKT